MADKRIVAPEVVGEDEVIFKHSITPTLAKEVFRRRFQYPHGVVDWVVWGSRNLALVIFPVTADGKVIVLRQFGHALTPPRFVLELPGGNVESLGKAETVSEELESETGFAAEKVEIIGGEFFTNPRSDITPIIPVLATGCRKIGEPKPEKTEVFETILFPVWDWSREIFSGKIEDAKTVVVSLLALGRLGFRLIRP